MMSPLLWSSGEPVPNQLVGFGGNFLKFKSGANTRGGGGWADVRVINGGLAGRQL